MEHFGAAIVQRCKIFLRQKSAGGAVEELVTGCRLWRRFQRYGIKIRITFSTIPSVRRAFHSVAKPAQAVHTIAVNLNIIRRLGQGTLLARLLNTAIQASCSA
jgi:hypothetical protein